MNFGNPLATARRNRIAREQEEAVTALLTQMNWQRLPSRLIDQRAQVPAKHFMHKTRFASGPNENQEVDVACGLGGTVVLAMECKCSGATGPSSSMSGWRPDCPSIGLRYHVVTS